MRELVNHRKDLQEILLMYLMARQRAGRQDKITHTLLLKVSSIILSTGLKKYLCKCKITSEYQKIIISQVINPPSPHILYIAISPGLRLSAEERTHLRITTFSKQIRQRYGKKIQKFLYVVSPPQMDIITYPFPQPLGPLLPFTSGEIIRIFYHFNFPLGL